MKAGAGPVAYSFSDDQILKLIELTGSVGLAVDALCMIPQPRFIKHL